ncbi:winged helix-turn-helix transcriptional regulator [Clostridium botulinum]|uniref:ArsR/SmtB family transcription factor n=1 Tax=Clostridium botulinum TaxID=1491 RepID=UPI0001F850F7|nr:metalloregulator ArsR/SmtB family transcription factor [Clostridium botulinum]NFB16856.1 ArsR family transcriptional regulator [Clostridium botulinum]NFB67401.1 ArsR family transcriptional regulator [Clostridium botulinum]NFB97694.1 ArsR family transcriptional regulator [Clostridium botulinum]NFC46299.1 ArsR family transcriptional regulator [Clostridium botulinum]NFC56939.1 ArsR family transcriptional regulator [Clostridium botulinum]
MDNDYTRYNDMAELLKVLSHPVRICIVKGLLEKGECNVSHMQNCLDMPQSTISQHLQKLKSAGIIEGDRNGLQINYHVCNKKAEQLIKILLNE